MAYYTSIKARGVGLIEIFSDPQGREWQEIAMLADPIDGVRGYIVGDRFYVWGSLPLHRDLRPFLADHLADKDSAWVGVQIMPALQSVTVTECTDAEGRPLHIVGLDEVIRHSMPLMRVVGEDFDARLLDCEHLPALLDV